MDIKENVKKILNEIGNVKLIAVTKGISIDEIQKAKEAGIYSFGENRLNEAQEKIKNIEGEWHFIGNLQSNKIKKVVEIFNVIQSVDTLSKALLIDKEAKKINKKQKIMIQINIGGENQKGGINAEDIKEFLFDLNHLKNINIIGLMCIAPREVDARPYFKKMKKIFNETNLKELSMGMTNDYKIAIEESSTMIRVGRGIFQ